MRLLQRKSLQSHWGCCHICAFLTSWGGPSTTKYAGYTKNVFHIGRHHVKACRDCGSLLVVAAVVTIFAPEGLEEDAAFTRGAS